MKNKWKHKYITTNPKIHIIIKKQIKVNLKKQ